MALDKTAASIHNFYRMHPVAYNLLVGAACMVVYFFVLYWFKQVPAFNETVQVRPVSGVGPVLGLFFGMPGILGCSLGNAIMDVMGGATAYKVCKYFVIQVIYNGFLWAVWYLVFRKKTNPFPRFDTSGRVALYFMAVVIDSIIVVLLLSPITPEYAYVLDKNTVRMLNNFIFLVYLGVPLFLILENSPLVPIAPHAIRATYTRRARMNLTQRLVILCTMIAALFNTLFIAIGYAPYFVSLDENFGDVVSSMYFMAAFLTVVIFTPVLMLIAFLEKRFTQPLEVLTRAVQDFISQVQNRDQAKTALVVDDIPEIRIRPRLEVRDLFDATNKMRSDVVGYINQLSAITAEKERAAAELDIATQIQMGAVPHDFSFFEDRYCLRIDATMIPAREVGGDFYDVFDLGHGRVGFIIGDVSGKGVPAALFMMRAQSLLRQYMMENNDLGTAMTLANRQLCERNDAMLFVTAFAVVLHTTNGHVQFANAGHNPPWVQCGGRKSYLKVKPALVLGLMDTVTYKTFDLDLEPGDGMVLYTDGVTEATDIREELYGEDRLAQVLSTYDATRESCTSAVVNSVNEFVGDAPQADDITMLAFRWDMPVKRLLLEPQDENLDVLFDFLSQFSQGDGRTPKMQYDLMLVCEEAFVNICHYGFPEGHPRLPVLVSAALDEENQQLHLMLSDHGIAYNPLGFEPEKVGIGKDNRIGGLGILLMRQYTDGLRYERTDGCNILHITKKFV